MKAVFEKITKLFVGDDFHFGIKKQALPPAQPTDRDLLRQESKIGATLFGEVPSGRVREFFCLDESTWVWHEEWKDEKGVQHQSTVRYEIHQNGILKVSDGPRYTFIEGDELENFAKATRAYYDATERQIYSGRSQVGTFA